MKVFVTGGTGAIGPATIRGLVTAGHDVRAVARSDEKAALVKDLGAEPVAVDLFDADAVQAAVAGSDGVLHLATNVPKLSRALRMSAWAHHNALRTVATDHLVRAARAADAGVFVKESVEFVYPDRGDEWIDEDTPADETVELLQPTLDGERIALGFAGDGRTTAVLRFGLFYGPHVRAVDEMLRLARGRLSSLAGKPGAYVPSVHIDDVANAAVAALSVPTGVYNVSDDEPLTRREYLDAFSSAFGLGKLMINPAWPMRLVAGKAAQALTASHRCRNTRFRDVAGWAPQFRSAREGWPVAAAVRAKEDVHA
jgi:nucleoside-diphosphate-sugar epimerase